VIFALLIIILTMIIAVKSERQDRWQRKPDYWRLGQGAVIFGLSWFYYLAVEPLTRINKEVREMKQRSSSASAFNYFLWVFTVFVSIIVIMLIAYAVIWLKSEMIWSWQTFYGWLLFIYISGLYLVSGLELAVVQWRSKLKYQNGGVFFLVNIFELSLVTIARPAIGIYFLLDDYSGF